MAALVCGCQSIKPPPRQIAQVNQLLTDRAPVQWNAADLLNSSPADDDPPAGELTASDAVDRALTRNLALVASAENLTLAHAQLIQAGLIANPVIGQSSGWLFPISGQGGVPSVDANIQQMVSSIFTQPQRVSIAKLQQVQANIDFASQAYTLAQQVTAKYQEIVRLVRARRLAQRISDLYLRAVRAAEARRRVGIIPTPELNRARLNYEDARRQVQHLTTQYQRAAREMNWLMGYSTAPLWRLPESVLRDVPINLRLPQVGPLEELALRYRLDLLRADYDRKLATHGLELARVGLIPQTTIGFEAARDSSRNWVAGPWLVSMTLPIFDPGFVALQLAKAQQRKADKTYLALHGQVRQDVRTALDNWRIADDDVNFFRERLIPQQEENVRLMELSFRLGNDDLDSLLNVYQSYVSQLQAYEDAIQASHDATLALQQAVGLTWERIIAQPGATRAVTRPAATQPGTFPTTSFEPQTEPVSQPATEPFELEQRP